MAAITPIGTILSANGKVKVSANVQSKSGSGALGGKSLKSQRTYQVGVVYKDIYGRETPVFTSGTGSFTVPKDLSDKRNSIVTNLENITPTWVDTFKFFVKETSNGYYNACMDRWYDAEDDNIWLSFPSAERNKIKEDGFIILKKQAASQTAVHEEARYKVIDIKNEAPIDIKTNYETYGQSMLRVNANGALPGSKLINFKQTTTDNGWVDSVFYDAILVGNTAVNTATPGITDTGFIGWPLDDVVIKLEDGAGSTTGWLDVANIYRETAVLHVALSKALTGSTNPVPGSTDSTYTSSISSVIENPEAFADVTVKIAKRVVKHKPEFDGKFFVKIARDTVLDTNIREVGNVSPNFSVLKEIEQYSLTTTTGNSTPHHWSTVGERWFIDGASRAQAGSEIWMNYASTNYKGPFDRDNGFGMIGDEITNPATRRFGDSQTYLRCTMELTLNRIKDTDKDGYSIANNSSSNQDFYSKMKSPGTLFRWREDPFQHIYRVSGTPGISDNENADKGPPNKSWKKGILNYDSSKSGRKEPKNKSVRLYLKFVTTGYRLNAPQGTTGAYEKFEDEVGLSPFNYKNSYPADPTLIEANSVPSTWDPTKRGFGTYGSNVGTSSYADSTAGSPLSWITINQNDGSPDMDYSQHNTLQIVSMETGDEDPVFTKDPAIWETEPREDVGLDIYYEASQAYPTRLTDQTNELFAPYGCAVTCVDARDDKSFYLPKNTVLYDWAPTGNSGNALLLNVRINEVGTVDNNIPIDDPITAVTTNPLLGQSALPDLNTTLLGLELQFTRPDGSYTTAKVKEYSAWSPNNTNVNPLNPVLLGTELVKIILDRDLTNSKFQLPYFNCYSFNNGVESDRIRDDFNAVTIGKGVKASTVLPGLYKEEQRTNGLIYSGIYNSNSNVNNLNQFIGAEKITKDVPPSYGSIQKLKARDTNLVVFCEDKILKIIAYKDALYKADGNPDIVSTNKVLGNISSFAGEFGISTNPESYAEDSFRMYCTDKQRGKVLRISGDGVTAISDYGMVDYFGDNLKANNTLLGSFDDRKQEYNLTLKTQQKTLSFSESAKGWTSFKSFIPEDGLSINNNYYTFKDGNLWEHHANETRNNFYGDQHDSSVNVVFNEQSESVKSFASMKYEGTQAKVTQNVTDREYYNNENTSTIPNFLGKQGWYVESGITDLQEAGEMEFKSKEGKYFSYMKGKPVEGASDLDSKEFSFQGIALLSSITDNGEGGSESVVIPGCTDILAANYDSTATTDNGSCIYPTTTVYGCTDINALNYHAGATVDDGSCVYPQVAFTITVSDVGDAD